MSQFTNWLQQQFGLYPAQRLYYNAVEGKPAARAPGSTALEFPNPTGHP